MAAAYVFLGVLFVLALLAVFIGSVPLAAQATAAVLPLDERFSRVVEENLPVRGRWLRMGLRALLFPVVLMTFWFIGISILFTLVG